MIFALQLAAGLAVTATTVGNFLGVVEGCFRYNIDYAGKEVLKIKAKLIKTPQECQNFCKKDDRCYFFSWTDDNCYLKSEKTEETPKEGVVSGPKTCVNNNFVKDGAGCYENGYNYEGHDLQYVTGIETAELCQVECASNKDCMYFTFKANTKVCYLKSILAIGNRKPNAITVSGPRKCLPSPQKNCYENDIDYHGVDLIHIQDPQIMTAEDCQRRCQKNQSCTFFSFSKSKDCYLKSGDTMFTRVPTNGVISGPKSCPGQSSKSILAPKIITSSGTEVNVEYRGYTIKTLKSVRSAPGCQAHCQSAAECFYWTWTKDKTCALKSAEALRGWAQDDGTLAKISGCKTCIPLNPRCHKNDTDVNGDIVQDLRNMSTYDVCQTNCQLSKQCYYWTWEMATKKCLLKSKASSPEFKTTDATKGSISGPKFCDTDGVCYEPGNYLGFDLDEVWGVESPVECRKLCKANSECEFWTWTESLRTCNLKDKSAIIGRTTDLTSMGRYSGPRDCPIHVGCLEINVAYKGNDLDVLVGVPDHLKCAEKCNEKPECRAYTYFGDLRSCYLKETALAEDSLILLGSLSSKKSCKKESTAVASCIQQGYAYQGKLLTVDDVEEDLESCHAICKRNSHCHYFSFNATEGCQLFGTGAKLNVAKDSSTISGTSLCGETYKPDFVQLNLVFTSKILENGSTYAMTRGQCAKLCDERENCYGWTYGSGQRPVNCFLVDAGATQQELHGWVSGKKLILPSIYQGFEYDGMPILTPRIIRTPEECDTLCMFTPMCRHWSFMIDSQTCRVFDEATTNHLVPNTLAVSGTSAVLGQVLYGMLIEAKNNSHITTTSLQACQMRCIENTKCHAYAFNMDENLCTLSEDKSIGFEKDDVYASGVLVDTSAITEVAQLGKILTGIVMIVAEIKTEDYSNESGVDTSDGSLNRDSAADCRDACLTFDQCSKWSWVPATSGERNCSLFATSTQVAQAERRDGVSGSRFARFAR